MGKIMRYEFTLMKIQKLPKMTMMKQPKYEKKVKIDKCHSCEIKGKNFRKGYKMVEMMRKLTMSIK